MRATLALNGLSQSWYSVNILIRAVVSHQEWVTYFKKLKEKLSVVDELLFTLVNKFLKFFFKIHCEKGSNFTFFPGVEIL